MPRFKLLLLDAGIVIGLHELGLWDKLIALCDVTLTRTVAEDEVVFWEDTSGQRHYIARQLQDDIAAGRIHCMDVPLDQIHAFRKRFDPTYLDRLDPGESESLAFLLSSPEEWLISSADSIVFKVLGRLHLPQRGISLEEILTQTGLSKPVHWKYTEAFRLKCTREGQQDSITDTGLR